MGWFSKDYKAEVNNRTGRVDSLGNRRSRARAHVEVTEEKVAKKITGRCTFFCGDLRCPAECPN